MYYPDFVISTKKNGHLIVETKGREDVDVEHKDKRAKLWCEDASKLTHSKWNFIGVDQEDFEKYRFRKIKELVFNLERQGIIFIPKTKDTVSVWSYTPNSAETFGFLS